jgi:DivIVA domain-containing protein
MGQLLLYLAAALVIAAIVFGVTVLLGGGDSGLTPAEPDGRAVPLPGDRPLVEEDMVRTRFDTALRGYRMSQVDQALQRAAYDIGYKGELIGVLEAEVQALRDGRIAEADALRRAREAALAPPVVPVVPDGPAAVTDAPEPLVKPPRPEEAASPPAIKNGAPPAGNDAPPATDSRPAVENGAPAATGEPAERR